MAAETKFIQLEGEKIEVEELLRVQFSFILYKAVHTEDYLLDILLNKSFAYWNETFKITREEAEQLIADPTFETALKLHRHH